MGKRVQAVCEECGQKFERSEFHPYIKKCKACRKGTGAFAGGKVKREMDAERTEQEFKRANGRKKNFQYIMDSANYGVKIKGCCITRMKHMLDNNRCTGECCCGSFRRVRTDLVGMGYAVYKIVDGELQLFRNHLETLPKLGKSKMVYTH